MESSENLNGLEVPKTIYKYFTLNQNFYHTIINKKLWFSNPSDFNDPFDCNIAFKDDYQESEIREYYKSTHTSDTPPRKLTEDEVLEFVNDWKNNPHHLQTIWFAPMREMVNSKGVCCFSGKWNDLLMWSHYADSHRGVCVGFDVKTLKIHFRQMDWVSYASEIPELDFLGHPNDAFRSLILHKAMDWQYEKEFRILWKNKGLIPFPKEAIKEIIFGCRCPELHIDSAMKLATSLSYENVSFKVARMHPKRFELGYEDLVFETVTEKLTDYLK